MHTPVVDVGHTCLYRGHVPGMAELLELQLLVGLIRGMELTLLQTVACFVFVCLSLGISVQNPD